MKNVFSTILLFGVVVCGLFSACTGGAYNATPSSNANYVINPLQPLKASQFTWGVGSTTGTLGGVINGVAWSTSNATWVLDTTGSNDIVGNIGSTMVFLRLKEVYTNNLYSMGYLQYDHACSYSDSVGKNYFAYYSYLGNSGEAYITENDSAYIRGMFYCECISASGQIAAINNGYFNIKKF